MLADPIARSEANGDERRGVARLESCWRHALGDAAVDDGKRIERQRDAPPRPGRRDDLVAALEHDGDAAHGRAETRGHAREIGAADVPRVSERHAPSRPRRIGFVDQDCRATGDVQRMRDGRADVARAQHGDDRARLPRALLAGHGGKGGGGAM
ncbi:MAG: hypothetical protein ABIX11_14985 [Casimicrobiaceae bacterium]